MAFAKGHARLNKGPVWNKGLTADTEPRLASGERNGSYGKHPSEETILKISTSRKEGILSGRIKTRRGVKVSEESKEKNRQAHIGIPMSPLCKSILLEASKRPKSEEHKRKIGLSQLGKKISMETREKNRQAALVRDMSGENNPNFGKQASDKCKAINSEIMKQRWLINRELEIRRTSQGRKARPTDLEKRIMKLLTDNNLPFDYVGDGKVILGGLVPDFINTNGRKEIIEAFGCYWHGCQLCHPGSNPDRLGRADIRGAIYQQFGFHTLVIWEHEMKEPDKVLAKVNDWRQSHDRKSN
jgi:G:T-mismatch repair DNA endonuclease (very short patch repair protein)